MVLSVCSKGGLAKLNCFIFSLLIAVASAATAQQEERVFGQYLRYLMQQEGYNLTKAIKEIQSLQQGREEIIQSYIKTEQDLQNLEKSAVLTEQSELDYYEKLYSESELPKWEESGDSLSDVPSLRLRTGPADEYAETLWDKSPAWRDIDLEPTFEIKPPRFRVLSITETVKEGKPTIELMLQNSGGETTVSVSVTTPDGTIIAKPYSTELPDFSGKAVLDFWLLQHPEKLSIQLETESKTYAIPVFLGTSYSQPTINASPFEASCPVGETVSYALTLEGSPSDRRRYNLEVQGLPKGISYQIVEAEAKIPVRSVRFSQAFPKHQLILQVTVSKDLPIKLLGKSREFSFQMGDFSETLTITPVGVGKITIDSPQTPINLSLGDKINVSIAITNIGSKDIDALYLLADRTVMGISTESIEKISLKIGERKEMELTVSASKKARIGRHTLRIAILSEKVRGSTTIPLIVTEKEFSFLSIASYDMRAITKPLLQFLGVAAFGFFIGIWFSLRKRKVLDDFELEDI
ncbi:TPA: hypothetical protein EYP66_06620 [Candidatus Poribacteria bacterium]|nr:hypothetical protein [Candidatus Poribacteria bacterium]